MKILRIEFREEIKHSEIPAFRGAIIEKVGRENALFHNHNNEGFHYRYPLIQYKRLHKKAAIVCIEEGVEDIHKLFSQRDWQIEFRDRSLDLRIEHLETDIFEPQITAKLNNYRLFDWLALDEKNYKVFRNLETEAEQLLFLEKRLVSNILAFANGINWRVEGQILVRIHPDYETKSVYFKQTKLLGFNLHFATNVLLPKKIGLGKGASMGYGTIL
jgi:hypothetical protein